jgi:2-polyprenyl-3-methyl-5-hydroxy-6-metoxy-1,4-benzoquinol methylase
MAICAVCQSADSAPYVTKKAWTYVKCRACEFVFVDPMPGQLELNELYQNQATPADTGNSGPSAYPKAASRRRRALVRAVSLLPYLWHKDFIDVGCGGGFMVEASRRVGARASGLDIDHSAVDYARNNFPHCTFHSASFDHFNPDKTYAFVYSSELIEHVARLGDYMDLIQRLTHIGSHVFITTPDIASPRVPRDVCEWDVFGPPYHVQFFQESNLTRLFEARGFVKQKRSHDRKAGLKVLFRRIA